MTATTNERPKNKRGSRGRADRPSQVRRGAASPGGRPRGGRPDYAARDDHAERSEALAREGMRSAAPGARDAYARRFREALLQEVAAIGSPVDSGVLALAYSRAAVASADWSGTGVHPKDAEEVRLRVGAEERASLRVEALRGGMLLTPWGDLVQHAPASEDDVQVPRGRALDDERPRRGGRR